MIEDTDPEYVLQVRKSKEEMPRYKIANNHEYFELMFKLLEN
jgi:hypothetical protein